MRTALCSRNLKKNKISKIKITDLLDDLIARVPEKSTIHYIVISKNLMYQLLKEQIPGELHTSVRITNYKGKMHLSKAEAALLIIELWKFINDEK